MEGRLVGRRATAFEQEFHIPYPSVFDRSGEIRDGLGFIGQLDTIFFRADGSRAATWSGPLDQNVMSTNIGSAARDVGLAECPRERIGIG